MSFLDDDLEFKTRRPRRGVRDTDYKYWFWTRLGRSEYRKALASGRPQCMFKVICQGKGAEAKRILSYIARIDKDELTLETEAGARLKGEQAIDELYREWSQDFERKKPGRQREPKHVTHMMLSCKSDGSERMARKVEQAARQHLSDTLGERGFEYAFVMHRDTQHPHVHVVIKNYNRETQRKFHMNRVETFLFRQEWSQSLERFGIEAVATLRRDRTEILQRVEQGIEQIHDRTSWHASNTKKAKGLSFQQRMKMSMRVSYMKKQVRAHTLPLSEKRKQYMKELRSIDEQIRSGSPEAIRTSARASIRTIGQGISQCSALLSDMANTTSASVVLPGLQRSGRKRKQNMQALYRSISKDIEGAIEYLRRTQMPPAERKRIAGQLKDYQAAARSLSINGAGQVRSPTLNRKPGKSFDRE